MLDLLILIDSADQKGNHPLQICRITSFKLVHYQSRNKKETIRKNETKTMQ